MFVFEISLKFKKESKKEIIDNFWCFTASLLNNGQILNGLRVITESNDKIIVTVICPEINSLETEFSDKYVISDLNKLEEISEEKTKIKLIGKDAELNDIKNIQCCQKTTFYILHTHFFKIDSPIYCGNCFKSIPLYKILKEQSNGVLAWQESYKACDWLQLSCSVGEKFGLKEMSNFNSNLTKDALGVCETIEQVTGKPVFYYLFNYRNISHKKDLNRKCPSCGGEWLLKKELHNLFNFKCEKCKLLSAFTCN